DARTALSGDDGEGARRHVEDHARREDGLRPRSLYRRRAARAGGSRQMNRATLGFGLLVGLGFIALVLRLGLYTVDPTEQALVLRFGQPVGDVIGESGLHAKAPFIDNVVYIDRRILALEDERQEVLVAENQRLE